MFIVFLSAMRRPEAKIRKVTTVVAVPTPMKPGKLLEPENPPVDLNEKYEVVPENFKRVDFRNHSYGLYAYRDEKPFALRLTNGELPMSSYVSWFSLKDVHYKDLTGDGKPEAIVRLSHVQCSVSCDGGSNLFYVYTQHNGRLKTLWQYETGSYGYGCGLKSFTASHNQIVVELFGQCSKQRMEDPRSSKFLAKDLTYILFQFDGRTFKQQTIQVFESSTVDVKNYEPLIYMF
ncbi:MAG TPA: hypothetical protein VLB46_08945 [Pyrinomonadaceae bacterium]|nr:hypothetical protein [Pyrinomonadaceae bacterium]